MIVHKFIAVQTNLFQSIAHDRQRAIAENVDLQQAGILNLIFFPFDDLDAFGSR
ncbi:MAG: hypothetical protein BWX60_00982 [Candidatus Marinimicrobia bacterium ADurb.Bin030]|nr:MAG: hypothetical protein BWX60_00982 [Candidatus Marinimicrobia bacterium ADurb.Bin030]